MEDDEHKLLQLRDFLSARNHEIVCIARSLQEALRELPKAHPHVTLIDMSLPIFGLSEGADSFAHMPFGGRDILALLEREEVASLAIVVTALDRFGEGSDAMTLSELNDELTDEYPELYLGAVGYSGVIDAWQEGLDVLLRQAASASNGGKNA